MRFGDNCFKGCRLGRRSCRRVIRPLVSARRNDHCRKQHASNTFYLGGYFIIQPKAFFKLVALFRAFMETMATFTRTPDFIGRQMRALSHMTLVTLLNSRHGNIGARF